MKTKIDELMNIAWKFAHAVDRNGRMNVDHEEDEMRKEFESLLVELRNATLEDAATMLLNACNTAAPLAQTPEKQKHSFVLWAEYETRIEALQNEAAFHKALSEKAMQAPPVTSEITRLKSVIEDMLLASAAPPAQTPPPRLTDAELDALDNIELEKLDYDVFKVNQQSVKDSFRAIETAVRKQFGVQE